MGSRFVRASAYRHTYGAPAKPENRYDNIKISGPFSDLVVPWSTEPHSALITYTTNA